MELPEQLFHLSVKAIIRRLDGKVLIIHAKPSDHVVGEHVLLDYWDLPGGRLKVGETELDCLQREVAEEVGITQFSAVGFFHNLAKDLEVKLKSGQRVKVVFHAYLCQIKNEPVIKLAPEFLNYAWTAPREAARHLANNYPPDFIVALENLA